jgi:hypothetical protein
MDLQKAFPSVPRKLLIDHLAKLGISAATLTLIVQLYQPEEVCIYVKGEEIRIQVDRGTKEGSCLSPVLFVLYVSDLPQELHYLSYLGPSIGQFSCFLLQFADDTGFIAETPDGLQDLFWGFADYCRRKQLTINPQKTQVILFRAGARGKQVEKWELQGETIEPSKTGDYLGVRLARGNVAGHHHIEKLRSRGTIKLYQLLQSIRKCQLYHVPFLLGIFKTLVMSSATYGLETLLPLRSDVYFCRLNPLITIFLRRLLSLPNRTSNAALACWGAINCFRCEAHVRAWSYLKLKLTRWGSNSPVVEELLQQQFQVRVHGTLEPSWLSAVTDFLQFDLGLEISFDTWDRFVGSITSIDKKALRAHVIENCRFSCFPAPSERPLALAFPLDSFHDLPFVKDVCSQFRPLYLFLTNSWRFTTQNLEFLDVSGICSFCEVPDTAWHWIQDCPLLIRPRQTFLARVYVEMDGGSIVFKSFLVLLEDLLGAIALQEFVEECLTLRRGVWLSDLAERYLAIGDILLDG